VEDSLAGASVTHGSGLDAENDTISRVVVL